MRACQAKCYTQIRIMMNILRAWTISTITASLVLGLVTAIEFGILSDLYSYAYISEGVIRGTIGVFLSSALTFGICFLILAILAKFFPLQMSKATYMLFGLVSGLTIIIIAGYPNNTAGFLLLFFFALAGMVGGWMFRKLLNV